MFCDGFAGQGACDGLSLGQQLLPSSQGKLSIFWFMYLCENGQELSKMATQESPCPQRFQPCAIPVYGNCGSRTQHSMASAWTTGSQRSSSGGSKLNPAV